MLGGSAGGYLTLTSGYRVRPRPNALVSFWGYGDLIGEWYSSPSPHERHRRVVMTEEEALAQVSGPPIANAADREGDGGAFYQYCRQHGIWPQQVSGWDPGKEAEKFFPYMPLKNVTADYPPTLLVHGTADTDVPYEQSQMMAAELDRRGIEHRLLTVEGAEHGLAGAPEDVKRTPTHRRCSLWKTTQRQTTLARRADLPHNRDAMLSRRAFPAAAAFATVAQGADFPVLPYEENRMAGGGACANRT